MRLHAWAHSISIDGAGSPANLQFLSGLLNRGSMAATPGMTISVDQATLQGIHCICVHFYPPQEYRGDSVPVLVPAACLGTGKYQPKHIFYALLEEIVAWLASVCPINTLVWLYQNNNSHPLPQLYSLNWQQLHSDLELFITSLRPSGNGYPGLGLISGAFGVLEVTQARTSSGEILADYVITLTLNNEQRMQLLLPHSVAQLPTEWLLDWLEVRNEFSPRV